MRILLAGGTGYLGGFITREMLNRGMEFSALARKPQKLRELGMQSDKIIRAEVTNPETLSGVCQDVDVVISTIGITRQTDGLSYMDVDYAANVNLLKEAQRSGVRKFIYVSVLHGEQLRNLAICDAKERFVEALQQSGLEYTVVRPGGFFGDLKEFYTMAQRGRGYLIGRGEFKSNPIHGKDLAEVCLDLLEQNVKNIEVGGPEVLTQRQMLETAFAALGTAPRILHIPEWLRTMTLKLGRYLMPATRFGPLEFFLTVMARDMVAPKYGIHTLRDYFGLLNRGDA